MQGGTGRYGTGRSNAAATDYIEHTGAPAREEQ